MVWPDVTPEWKLIENTNLTAWEPCIYQIFNILDQLQFDNGQPVILSFTKDAQVSFNQWQQELETRLRKDNLPPHLEAHLAKYKKLLPALCLIFEHMRMALDNQYPQEISRDCLEKVLIWLKYFESHVYRIYGSSTNAVPDAACRLIKLIQQKKLQIPFTVRDVYNGNHWAGLSTSDEVKEVLSFLSERNYVKEIEVQTRGRKTTKYWVHPKILEQCHE